MRCLKDGSAKCSAGSALGCEAQVKELSLLANVKLKPRGQSAGLPISRLWFRLLPGAGWAFPLFQLVVHP